MSETRFSKRSANKNDGINSKFHINEMQTLLNTLLNPILQEIVILNEMVTSILNIVNKRENDESDKITKNCEFASSSIAMDVTMMASSIHRLTKNYENMKDQVVENQKNIDKFYEKLNNIERLLMTSLKVQNNRAMKQVEEQVLEKVSGLEQMLLGGVDMKQGNNESSSTASPGIKQFQVKASVGLDSSLQLITLNSEEDYPNGSWLGDISSPKCRVRCSISEKDLFFINTRCATPVKMALTLLDYLFTKETLAVSNLSGKSKLGKKQLDPLMIYGIKCHLMHHFNISEKQWERIKRNIDSKCRWAWKKRKLSSELNHIQQEVSVVETEKFQHEKEEPKMIEEVEQVMVEGLKTQVIHTLQGHIEVLQTTQDQILIQDIHNIHVLDGDHILPVISTDADDSDSPMQLTTAEMGVKDDCEENLTIITTNDNDLSAATDIVSFVTEPMLEVLTEDDSLKIDSSDIEEG
ncbi:UNVERIFIED_CONTAM: hypothetical protein PYX00_001743 [Menopon gallinae]|uniref:Protein BANP n=1 Tax=Menopon gallinae TaxID=328185 RepID=A0AAW2IG68_9NEOP